MKESENCIDIQGARVHNLKDVSLKIPREKLVVITGLSGSGKSSLAFDTIYAEGQRRYMETFSAYVRQFLGNLERPDVDKIDGLSPVIAIEQKTTSKSPRSTVGTITELYDYIRLLFARVGTAYSYVTQEKMVNYSDDQILQLILEEYLNKKIIILSPLVKARKGHYRELFDSLSRQGFLRVRVDGTILDLTPGMRVDRYKTHDIELIVDRIRVKKEENDLKRLNDSIKTAMHYGEESIVLIDAESEKLRYFSRKLMCPTSGISYTLPEPNSFSFNSPKGMCLNCKGLGNQFDVSRNKIIPDENLSIDKGGIAPLGEKKSNWGFRQMEVIAKRYNFSLSDPIKNIPPEALDVILKGGNEKFSIASKSLGITRDYKIDYEGIENFIKHQFDHTDSSGIKRWAYGFMDEKKCSECDGSRLNKESLNFKIDGLNIAEVSALDLGDLFLWFESLDKHLSHNELKIAGEIIKEIKTRLQFLLNVGLNYLSLNRSSKSLSGGEAQRIRLATQIGSQLVGVLYILDEPSIGLHQRDNEKLINSLESLRDIGNSVIVVEHDKDMILRADHIIDIGPMAGKNGGKIISEGTPEMLKKQQTLTAQYLNHHKNIEVPEKRRKSNGKNIILSGCTGNNLKDVEINIPLGVMI
ncbi:MAG: excinuclease ABC subunit UvrA, partial [Flavobacteriaceae bacterium]